VIARAFRFLAPDETARARALPITLLVRPLPVVALVVLVVNDHALKGSGLLPSVVTGKLSDFAGLFFFPLLLVTLSNLASSTTARLASRDAWAAMGATTTQLAVACALTALLFSATKLSHGARDALVAILDVLYARTGLGRASVVVDPSDLVALPMIALAFWWGQGAIARVPPGRLAMARARAPSARDVDCVDDERVALLGLSDVRRACRREKRSEVDALARAIARGDDEAIDVSLAKLRA